MNRKKIAVYAIALNEEKFVERWYKSICDADYILLADTGSSDKTVEVAKSLGINVFEINVMPFRFDDARNLALSLVPRDIDFCIALDLDEVMTEGWYETLQKVPESVTRLKYKFVHRWNPDGTAASRHVVSKIHSRSGYRWKNPVHEMVYMYSGEEVEHVVEIEVQHFPDTRKSRSSYLGLLEIACKENPTSPQLQFWLGREHRNHRNHSKAVENLEKFLREFPETWGPEIAFAHIFLAELLEETRLEHLQQAVAKVPYLRETWVRLADYHWSKSEWADCRAAALEGSQLHGMPEIYLVERKLWVGPKLYDLIALSSHFLGDNEMAIQFGTKALDLDPDDSRLQNNLKVYLKAQGS